MIIISDKECYTVPEAAQKMGITAQTLRNYIAQGRVVSIKTKTRRLVPADEVQKFLTPVKVA